MRTRADRDVLYFEKFESVLTMINLQKEAPQHTKRDRDRGCPCLLWRKGRQSGEEGRAGLPRRKGVRSVKAGRSGLFRQSGSLTVEASFCATAFFLALFSLLYLFQMTAEINRVQMCLASAVQKYECLGTKLGTVDGLLRQSVLIQWDEEGGLCFVKERWQIPFLGGEFFQAALYQQMKLSDYRGRSMVSDSADEEEYVYVAENGRVFHRDRGCVYLNPGIQSVRYRIALERRNSSGGRYGQCRRCSRGVEFADDTVVFLTAYGDSYHIDRDCPGLKRTVRRIKRSSAGDMPACSKCGQR